MLPFSFSPPFHYNCTLTHGIAEHSRKMNERDGQESRHYDVSYLLNRQGRHHGLGILWQSTNAKPQSACQDGCGHQREGTPVSKRQGSPAPNAGFDSPETNQKAAEKTSLHHPRTVAHTLAYGNFSDTKAEGFRATWGLQIDSLSVAAHDSSCRYQRMIVSTVNNSGHCSSILRLSLLALAATLIRCLLVSRIRLPWFSCCSARNRTCSLR